MSTNSDIEAEQLQMEIHRRIRSHRRWVVLRTLILIAAMITAVILLYRYYTYHVYTDYEVKSSADRSDTPATSFAIFSKGLLKYSNDGAFYTSSENELIWNQTFEMENPKVDIRDRYMAIGDVGGKDLYLIDRDGKRGHLETTLPIEAFSVSGQGTAAVLLFADNRYYLRIYDADVRELAQGELFIKNSGYPLSLSLSPDRKKLAVASILPSGNGVSSTVTFYNFGAVGQNEQDNIVGTYTYEDLVIPEITFLNNDLAVAFGDNRVVLFSGKEKPEPVNELELTEEVKSVFWNEDYFGLVFHSGGEENTKRFEIYDRHGKNVLTKEFSMDYDTAEFLTDGEILFKSDYECALYNMQGVERFRYTFDTKLLCVIPEHLRMYYTFIKEGVTENVRLK